MPQFAAADGVRLHYDDLGAGLPVLCLPGLTRTGRDFDYLAPHLADVRLIRPDYRGRGLSDRADPATYTVAQEARDMLALMDHLGVARAAVIGTSRGGLIGMMLAAIAPGRLLGLCLNDVGPELAPEGLARILGYLGRRPAARTHLEAAAALERGSPGFSGVPFERWLAEARLHFRESREGLEITYDPRLREAFEAAAVPPADPWRLFEACAGLPLALIRGAGSDLLTAAAAAAMRARLPGMIWAEVPGRGHAPFLDEPESLAAIRAWLERTA
jgi:pimeloyl-ACP methyl ester carboxylesterase